VTHGTNAVRSLVDSAADFIDAHALLAPGAAVIVAVSGGCDSVALLAVMRELAGRKGRDYQLTAAHLDHALRPESPDDAQFVAAMAAGWDIPCITDRLDVAAQARRRGLGTEAAARTARYEFLARAAGLARAEAVAVGHHADDNVETVLHRILRGTHLRGAAGMAPARLLAGASARLIRPLLTCSRDDVEAFCRQGNLTWRTDPTNTDTAYTRNFIRHELLPLIRSRLNPNADEALGRLAAAAAEAEDLLAAQADTAYAKCIRPARRGQVAMAAEAMTGLHPALLRWVLRNALEQLPVPLAAVTARTFEQLSALAGTSASVAAPVNLPGGCVGRRDGRLISIAPSPETLQATGPKGQPVTLAAPGATDLPTGGQVICRLGPLDRRKFDAHCRDRPPGVEMLDADCLHGRLLCRPRTHGDRFHPMGSAGRQSVGDLLTNLKVPPHRRQAVRCICDDDGIIYVAPLRIDDRVKITPRTRRVLRIELQPPPKPPQGASVV
jgi:tRNA(Ile)-lysidine synthase